MAPRTACARPGPRLFLGCLVGAGESAAVPEQVFLLGSLQKRLEAVVGMRPVPAEVPVQGAGKPLGRLRPRPLRLSAVWHRHVI
jgi:hypothetical protein